MSTLKLKQGLSFLFILFPLLLASCAFFGRSIPASEATHAVDPERTIAREESKAGAAPAGGVSVPAERGAAEGEVSVEMAAEEALPALSFDKSEAVIGPDSDDIGGGGDTARLAATALPLATPAPRMVDLDGVTDSAAMEPGEEAMAGPVIEGDVERTVSEPVVQQIQPLQAGEVDDNAQWDDYLLYRRNYRGPGVHDRDISERYVIQVEDSQGQPVLGANVSIFLAGQPRQEIYSGRTYANGQMLFHPLALDYSLEQANRFLVEVQKDNLLQQFTLTRFNAQASTAFSERWTVNLDLQQSYDSINLDLLFLLDATGSMADEIAKIQSTIFEVAARIDAFPGQTELRYGLVTYRDRGDSFVTRSYEFTPDVRDFSQSLNTVYADGGDDYPESLNEGLHDALNSVEWRGEGAIQLIFLVADAPPHLDYAQDYDYALEMENAARRGIKIFPIASSGLDDQGEYIFRQIAQYTQGRFIFLTYEGPTNEGTPGEVTTHHVEDYSVQKLDDLLVRLVAEELAYQNPQLAQAQ